MPSNKWFEQRFDQIITVIDQQTSLLKEQGQTIKEQGQTIKEQGQTIKEQGLIIQKQSLIIQEQGELIKQLQSRIIVLETELIKVNKRLETIEARIDNICKMLPTFAPVVKELLNTDSDCILLDPEYKEMRDEEPEALFEGANSLAQTMPNYEAILANYKNKHGLASAIGKAMADFYKTVLGYKPRKVANKFGYLTDYEQPIIACPLKQFNGVI